MPTRRLVLAACATASLFAALPAAAGGDVVPYNAAAFDAAHGAGASILVEVHAPWCPTCRAQAPILEDLRKAPQFGELKVFRVDFDSQKDALKRFGVRTQSTLITFKGGKETGRSVGDTNRDSIAALLAKAI
ncbi:thioredoxin family protein [Pinisolibacter sp.]|uniref:thioredoxin family protein n=1 Tax=Pinisolibacter sp. TaxID=2172024 RepID=UPI002FDD82B3